MKASLLAMILLIIGVGTFLLWSGDKEIRNYPSSGTDIIAFGDSLIEGAGSTNGNDFISLLSRKIGKPIINLGVSGDTTEQGLARINELDHYNPKIVILLLGGNDHLRKVPIQETFANLGKIIEHIQSRGAVVLILGVRGSVFGDQFENYFEELENEYHTAYVSDVLSGLFGKNEYMSDAIHPNDAGYSMIAERVYPVLLELL